MNRIKEIQYWLNKSFKNDALFISIRFKTPPETKDMLCKRCQPIFKTLFKQELGRHWYKMYNKHFFLIGVKELGLYKNMHAHFILGFKQDINIESLIDSFKGISYKLGFDIWDSDYDKFINQKVYGNDIMIKRVYSAGVYSYITKEVFIYKTRIINDPFILDTDIYR